LSAAKGGKHRGQSLRDLVFSRFEYFLAVLVVSASIFVVVVALISPVIETSLSQPVVQGMIAIVSGVTGFFFGNRGVERAEERVERAEERVREVEDQLARGGPLAIQQERIEDELEEIRKRMEDAMEQARKASDLHYENQKIDADRYFRKADKSTKNSCNAMKAWIYANYAYLKLDREVPQYDEILDMFSKSQEYRDKTDFPDDLFPKRTSLGKAVAEINLGYDDNAIRSLNSIGSDIEEMQDLFDEDIKKEDIKKFLNSRSVDNLNVKVKKYLEKAKGKE
jgi:hypothetical protein